jgi:hypothetical protein
VSDSVLGPRAEVKCSRSVPHRAYHAKGVNPIMTIDIFPNGIAYERCQITRKAFW